MTRASRSPASGRTHLPLSFVRGMALHEPLEAGHEASCRQPARSGRSAPSRRPIRLVGDIKDRVNCVDHRAGEPLSVGTHPGLVVTSFAGGARPAPHRRHRARLFDRILSASSSSTSSPPTASASRRASSNGNSTALKVDQAEKTKSVSGSSSIGLPMRAGVASGLLPHEQRSVLPRDEADGTCRTLSASDEYTGQWAEMTESAGP